MRQLTGRAQPRVAIVQKGQNLVSFSGFVPSRRTISQTFPLRLSRTSSSA
jgi:hypothetical protein